MPQTKDLFKELTENLAFLMKRQTTRQIFGTTIKKKGLSSEAKLVISKSWFVILILLMNKVMNPSLKKKGTR